MAAIEISELSKRFGPVHAVSDLSFRVERGRITGFLGPNGAGKSTTLRILLGLVRADYGGARFEGRRYERLPHASGQVGAVLEGASFHPGRVDLVAPGVAILALLAWIGGLFAVGATLLRVRDVD